MKANNGAEKDGLPSGKVTACSAAALQRSVEQEVERPRTDLTGRHVHTSSQQISQRAVLCHLLLDRKRIGLGEKMLATFLKF